MIEQSNFQQRPDVSMKNHKKRKRRTLEERIAGLEVEIEAKRTDLAVLKRKKATQEKAEKERAAQKIVSEMIQVRGATELSAEEIQQAIQEALKKKQLFKL